MTRTHGRGRALCAGAAILALIAFAAVPARADPAPGNAPTYHTSQGNIGATQGVVLVGYDTVSGLPCYLGSTVTCALETKAIGGAVNPDVGSTGNALNSATLNAAYSVTPNNGEGVIAFSVAGLTASGATLSIEASDDLGASWAAINGVAPSTGAFFTTLTTDQQFRVNSGGRTRVRLRVSTAGTGTVTIASNAASVSSLVGFSGPLPDTSGGSLAAMAASAATIATELAAATPAGEAHIGEVGGNSTTVTVAQTVTASSAYASGNAVGGLITFAAAARISAGSGLIQNFSVNTKSTQTGAMDLLVFSANPTSSTCTDKTALAVAAADFSKWIYTIHVTDWTSGGTPSTGQANNLALQYSLPAGTSLYGCLVSRASPTFTAMSDVSINLGLLRN